MLALIDRKGTTKFAHRRMKTQKIEKKHKKNGKRKCTEALKTNDWHKKPILHFAQFYVKKVTKVIFRTPYEKMKSGAGDK